MSLKIGITGGIGSGKTTVCKIFSMLGIPILYADDLAKKLMTERLDIRADLILALGDNIYNEDGSLDKQAVSEIIFTDKEKLEEVNKIVHPAVYSYGESWFKRQIEAPYCLKEAALTFESGGDKFVDAVIVVSAPEKIRIERVMKRDGLSAKEVKARINNQMPASEKEKRADYVIINDGETSIIRQILEIHYTLQTKEKGDQWT